MTCYWPGLLSPFERPLSAVIRFGPASAWLIFRQSGFEESGFERVFQRRSSPSFSRAAKRSLNAPDSGSGKARRKAWARRSAAWAGSLGARRPGRSAKVGSFTIPSGTRFPLKSCKPPSETQRPSCTIGSEGIDRRRFFGLDPRSSQPCFSGAHWCIQAPFHGSSENIRSRRLAGFSRLRHFACALKHSAGA